MGGTGVLEFCGAINLQLLLSRRSPRILNNNFDHATDDEWGFTIVRREDPSGNRRSSSYTYLAPVGAEENPQEGHVLTFPSDTMPIFPEGPQPYVRESVSGTLIKLYEYSLPGHRTHVLLRTGLLSRLELLLPEIALPIRLHECRKGYAGGQASFDTNLTGLAVRLDEGGKAENMEPDFPSSAPLVCGGEEMKATIYAFKKGRAETYRSSEGILFTVNGQTHGHLTAEFFGRKSIGLRYLSDSILVIVDCTMISARGRELLFMNSRDRLRDGQLRRQVEQELEDVLKNHAGLRALRERRRREELNAKIEDSKPLEQILDNLIKHSPSLASLFLLGNRASNPFKQTETGSVEKPYVGVTYPTYFKFKGKEYGTTLDRESHLNARCRITFETDAVNDYFSRSIDPGAFVLFLVVDDQRFEAKSKSFSSNINSQNGVANLSIKFPESCKVDDKFCFAAVVTDSTRNEPFENLFTVLLQKPVQVTTGKGDRKKPSNGNAGGDREGPTGLEIPRPIHVSQENWDSKNPPFDQFTALRILDSGERGQAAAGQQQAVIYDFLINVDNVYLLRYLKSEVKKSEDDKIPKTRFELGMMLIGLALIHQNLLKSKASPQSEQSDQESNMLEKSVEEVTKALAPFLLPMIDALGALDETAVGAGSALGEST